jgi:hypothetical protein
VHIAIAVVPAALAPMPCGVKSWWGTNCVDLPDHASLKGRRHMVCVVLFGFMFRLLRLICYFRNTRNLNIGGAFDARLDELQAGHACTMRNTMQRRLVAENGKAVVPVSWQISGMHPRGLVRYNQTRLLMQAVNAPGNTSS